MTQKEVAILRYHPSICLELLRRTTEIQSGQAELGLKLEPMNS